MTGFSFGGGSTCSLTEMLSISYKSFLGTVSALGQGFPVVITVVDLAPDYGESHYIAPVRGAQPNSQAWVNGFPHAPWLVLNAYFARAFKEGRMPPIERDKIFIWARPHSKSATASDPVPRPRGWELVSSRFSSPLTFRRLKRKGCKGRR